MAQTKDMTGLRFSRLVVQRRAPNGPNWECRWECRCDCGNTVTVHGGNLRKGNTKSCGCLNLEAARKRLSLHGNHAHPLYSRWYAMVARCTNPKTAAWSNYGGRGIKVCARWFSFENFAADMGSPAPGLTLDRIDVNGDYEPNNCRWASMAEQNQNRRTNRVLTWNGKSQALCAWAKERSISVYALRHRLAIGWGLERALTEPVAPRRKKGR